MAKRIGSLRRKTRHKLSKPYRSKGKISISGFFQSFNVGDRVCLSAEPGYQKGMYFTPYMGKIGTVKGKQGKCFEVSIDDQGKEKKLLVHPIHLKRAR